MRTLLIHCLIISTLCSCGGGGGGGSEGGGGGKVSTGIRVLHASLDTSPVDLFLPAQSEEKISTYRFGIDGSYRKAEASTQLVLLTNANSPSEPVYSTNLAIAKDQLYSLLLIGSEDTANRSVRLIQDVIPEIPKGSAAVRVVHGVNDATSIRLIASGDSIASAEKGSASSYVIVTAGPQTVRVERSADSLNLFSGTIEFASGKAYTLLVAGEIEYFTKTSQFLDN